MAFLDKAIKWVMLVSGLLTCTMVYAAIAPEAALKNTFGESISGPLAETIVRNWGILIFLVGAMLIHGAFNTSTRGMALVVAGLSKIAFISLVLMQGDRFMAKAGVAVVLDGVMVLVFAVYLIGSRSQATT